MGLTYTKIKFSNPLKPHLQALEANTLVDSGAAMLCIPNHYRHQLELED